MAKLKPTLLLNSSETLTEGNEWIYHVAGRRTYYGTTKYHLYLDCHVLQNHMPHLGDKDGIMKTDKSTSDDWNVCKYCEKRKNGPQRKKDALKDKMKQIFKKK